MSKIPYHFYPIPPQLLTDEFLDDPAMMKIIRYIFKRISSEPSVVYPRTKKTELHLEPFEFIFGRLMCKKETGLSDKQIRTRMGQLMGQHFLKESASKRASTFTVYRLTTECFVKNKGQQKGQHFGHKKGQQKGHDLDIKKIRLKEESSSIPPSFLDATKSEDLGLTDRLSSDPKTNEIYPGIFITDKELKACEKVKGSIDEVKRAVKYIMENSSRKYPIKNWALCLTKWEIKDDLKPRIKDNEEYAKRLEEKYGMRPGWRCEVMRDTVKDVKELVFYNSTSTGNSQPIKLQFSESDFQKKAFKILKDKNMAESITENRR